MRDAVLAPLLVALWMHNYSVYGRRKLWKAAQRAGIDAGRDQVARLMRANSLRGASRAKKRFTTKADPEHTRAPDLVKRNFTATRPDELWVADFTYSAQFSVMCSRRRSAPCVTGFASGKTAHNHRPSRKARSRSRGRNRVVLGSGRSRRLSVASLVARSASRYWCVTAGLECPSQRAMTARSVPDSNRCMAVECRIVCGETRCPRSVGQVCWAVGHGTVEPVAHP